MNDLMRAFGHVIPFNKTLTGFQFGELIDKIYDNDKARYYSAVARRSFKVTRSPGGYCIEHAHNWSRRFDMVWCEKYEKSPLT